MDFNSYINTDTGANANQNTNTNPTVTYSYNPATGLNQGSAYPATNGYYYPTYMPSNVNYTPQGMNFTQPYYPMVDPQTLMNQFAQFMSMMGTQQAVPPQPAPVIEGQMFPPPDSYTCNRCKQKGHWIQFCPLLKKNDKKKKPSYSVTTQKIECKTCNKWFISEEKKEEHMKKHEPCPYPNCSFSAIEKVLQNHISSVHQKAQSKIPQSLLELIPEKYRYASSIGNNPDDIRKWREERKRKYPTQQNIDKKMAAKETVEQAGGLIEHEDKRRDETPHFTYLSGKKVALCSNYLNGTCKQGVKCKLLHDPCRKNKDLCKAFTRGYCAKGTKCKKMHSPSDRLTWLKQNSVEPNIPSLLSQLLDGDVLNENSCILQCFQYIIDEGLIPAPDSLKKVKQESESDEVSDSSDSSNSSDSSDSDDSSDSNDSNDSNDSDDSDDSSDSSNSSKESSEGENRSQGNENEQLST